MIKSFGDAATRDIYNGIASKETRRFSREVIRAAVRKLDMLDAAPSETSLRVPPANRLEKLQGDRKGLWSIRVNDQFRIIFRFADGHAHDVRLVDYH